MNYENEIQIPHDKNANYAQFFTSRIADTIKVFEGEVAKYLINRCEANLEVIFIERIYLF